MICPWRPWKIFRAREWRHLRYLSDAPLRRRVTAATNKVESFNRFSQWIGFGNRGVIADNDPIEQEKAMNFNALLTNAVIFHNTLDIAEIVRQLLEEGPVSRESLLRVRHRPGYSHNASLRRASVPLLSENGFCERIQDRKRSGERLLISLAQRTVYEIGRSREADETAM
ncbi:Tn3 family transposase [Streptomyces sp. NPDC005989]|uniref:Tn3 family transposase n=1 Tax=Streptomyces sp. NPDC005989 TaxID=3156727 RepID=UPI0033F59E6E